MRAKNCPPIRERFYSKTRRDQTGCLLWTGATCGSRLIYGAFTWHERKQVTAHRAAWMLEVGPIPEGHQIDHMCKNPLCVDVAHLEPVPPRVNNYRSTSPSALNSRKTNCPAGHGYSDENTYVDPKGKRHCRTCRLARNRAASAVRAALTDPEVTP